MIIHDVEQGSPEWFQARCGVLTASCFNKILTPAKLDISKQSGEYENKLVAERLTGNPIDDFGGTIWTERGKELESDAISLYEMLYNVKCQKIGFVTNDDKTIGCSPDMLVGDDGGLELKCPAPDTHIGYLLRDVLPQEYRLQVYGCMFVTGRKWWDFMSYHPDLPPFYRRTYWNDEIIHKISIGIEESVKSIKNKIETIKEKYGVIIDNPHPFPDIIVND